MGGTIMDATTRESVQRDGPRFAVTSASGNDNGAGEEDSSILHHEFVGAPLAPKLNNCAGHRHLRSELLCLSDRARGEFLTGHASWKSQIILDLRTGARLPSGCVAFNKESIQSFRGPI